MPVQQIHQKLYKFDYNIIHDEVDANFAYNLANYLTRVKPHWKGFYSDQRLPGKSKLTAAQDEIENSQVNVCLTKPSLDKTVEHMHKCAVHTAIENNTLDQLIFVVHGGQFKTDVIRRYGLTKTCKVIEFLSPGDLLGQEELTQELESALDGTGEEGRKVEKMPVEETGDPGQYPRAHGQQSTQKPYLHHAQYLGQMQPADHAGAGYDIRKTPDQVFRDMLTVVAQELTIREVECLKFLLAPSRREAHDLRTSLQVLEFLEKTHGLNYSKSQILIDMLEVIDRDDLAGIVTRQSSNPVSGSGISPYRKMLFTVAESFTEVTHLKPVLVKQYGFTQKAVNDCRNGMDLCTLLETEDQIADSDCLKTAKFLKEFSKYLDEQTRNDVHICISEWEKDPTVSVDGSVPDMARGMEAQNNIITSIIAKNPSLAKLCESYMKCDVEMFKYMDSEEIHSYLNGKRSTEVGHGGFGKVYGGHKKYCDVPVVVKVSKDCNEERKRQFNREMSCAVVKHYALLPVLAVCDDSPRAYRIMYPWMAKSDLSRYLTNQLKFESTLGCKGYVRILVQIAEALEFLHTTVPHIRQPIRHGDVKPTNVLLDGNFWAKLSDAGLADEMEVLRSHITATRIEGTSVYYDKSTFNDAEDKYEKKLTNDVYAFGLIVAQVVSEISTEQLYHRQDYWIQKAMMTQLPLGNLWTKDVDSHRTGEKLGELVKHCISANVRDRKTMGDVVQVLKGVQNSSAVQTSFEKCVQCLVNQTAKELPCRCGCTIFCQSCLKRAYANPLRCPNHGPTQPPIGHNKVYAILAAPSSGDDTNTFNNDVGKVYRIFTDPKIMGIKESNIFQLVEKGDRRQKWESKAENLWKVLDKVKSKSDKESTVIFYITCHADKDSFKLSDKELVERKEVARRLSQIQFTTLLLICDCCCAADNMSILDNIEMQNENVHQWYSCCSDQKSFVTEGSVFTSYILEGLSGQIQEKGALAPVVHTWAYNQYVDFGNLQKYVNLRMEEFRNNFKTHQMPRVHSAFTRQLPLAYYNSPDQLAPSIVCQGLEDQKFKVKLERRPCHYTDLETLKKHVWKKMGEAYPTLDASYLQLVVPVYSHGEISYREFQEAQDLKNKPEEKLICQFRQNYLVSGRPLVRSLNPKNPDVGAWKRSLQLHRLRPFITEKCTDEYQVTLHGQSFVSVMETCLGPEGHRNVERDCLEVLKDVLKGTDGSVIEIRFQQNYMTMKVLARDKLKL